MPSAGDPILAADLATLAAYTTGKPIGRLVQQAAQSIVSGTTMVGVSFAAGSEDIDTHNFHDTASNNTRVTPTVAGYYRVNAGLALAGDTDIATAEVAVMRNGVGLAPAHRIAPAQISQTRVFSTEAFVACDGVSDYFETGVRQANTSANAILTVVSVQFASTLTWEFMRPL